MSPSSVVEPATTTAEADRFRALFRAEHGWMFATMRRLGVRERDLEDLVHDVFVVVHRKLAELDPARPPRPWLFAVAFRVASDYRRLARHQREVVDDEPPAVDATPAADELVARAEGQRLVIEALDGIEDTRRAIFILVELDEVPVTDAAEALGVPLNTAYSRLRLAREDFQKAVQRIRARRGARP